MWHIELGLRLDSWITIDLSSNENESEVTCVRFILLALGLLLFSESLAFGQNPAASGETPAQKKKKMQEKFKSTPFNAQMALPGVPDYPAPKGASKFVRGIKYSALGQGDNCVVQSILLRDPPEVVRDWYQATLSSQGWLVQPANPRSTQILGRKRKEGSSVHVMATPSPEKPWKCMLQVRYVQFQPLDEN